MKIYSPIIARLGLGFVFLANSLTTWFTPEEFMELIGQHPYLIKLIGISDGLVAVCLLAGFFPKWAAHWAAVWITGVIGVLVFHQQWFNAMEHIGFLALAFILIDYARSS